MGKVKGKHRLDKYYHLAKEQGYRSRAAWKLIQLDSKFNFLRSSQSVLDLCAAPGGWMQVAVKRVPVGSLVIGVDLDPIRPIRGAISVQQDITTPKCRSTIKKLMADNGCRAFDLVLHDGSPNVGGAWAKEATSQNSLVIDSVKLATELLAPKGTFITKIFRSQDYNAVLYCLRQLFEKVEVDKPLASRSASAEIYVVGFKYKAPSKIDPRLLDVKHLFQGGKEPPKVIDVLGGTKQKRHRDGYEDGATVLRKVCSVANFVWSDNPVQVLGSFTSMSFDDPACLAIRDHTLTTEEVKSLCDDLRILAKQDFKYLLKWRMQIRKALSPEKTKTPTVVESESKEDEDESEDEEERVLNEIEEKTNILEKKQKKQKKLQAKRRAKEKARKALGIQVDATEDGYGDQNLFSLSSIKGHKDLVAVDNSEYDKETAEVSDESDEEAQEHSSSDLDSEDERRRHDDNIEALFDEAYEQYLGRVEGKSKQRKRSKQAHLEDDQLLQDGNDDRTMIHSTQNSESDMEDNEVNPLVVPLEDAPPQEEIVKKWFTQDVFAEAEEQDVLVKYDSEDEMQIDGGVKKIQKSKELTNDKQQGEMKDLTRKTKGGLLVSASKTADDFEIVPAPATDSSDSSSDESDDDIDTKAEILATAKMMLRKRPREEMIDDAYNRYMFHDEGLPKWFIDEEKRNFQPGKNASNGDEGYGFDLCQILRGAKLNVLDFFKELPQFIVKVGPILSNLYGSGWEKRLQAKELQTNFVHLSLLSKYYKRAYQELFLSSNSNEDNQSATANSTILLPQYYRFGWLLFLSLREHVFSRFKDLVTCTNGLVSVLAILITHVPVCFRNFNINDSHRFVKKGDKVDLLVSLSTIYQTSIDDLRETMDKVNSLITAKLKNKPCLASECKAENLEHIDTDGLTYFENLLEESSLSSSISILEKDYSDAIQNKGELDERIFVNDEDSLLGSGSLSGGAVNMNGIKKKFDTMASPTKTITSPLSPYRSPGASNNNNPNCGNSKMAATPVTTAMTTARWLRTVIAPLQPKPSAELERFLSSCDRNVSADVIRRAHIILEAIFPSSGPGELCAAGSLQSTSLMDNIWAEQRRSEALKLYYRVLQAMCVAESQILHVTNLTSLLTNERFHRCMLACSAELVLATHKTVTMLFPAVLERTGITSFDLSKVIESFIRHEESLPRELRRHLNSLEERLLESMVWEKGSSMYNSLTVARPSLSAEINRLGLLAEPMPSLDAIAMHINSSSGNLPPVPPLQKSDLASNGHICDIRSPKRLCTEYRSVLVERNSFTSPVKDRFLALTNIKSKFPPPLQSAFASPTRPNPGGGGETCAETSINVFFGKIVKLAAVRINGMIERLQLSQQIRETVYCLFQKILNQRTTLFFNRHIDQIILCSFYGVAKISQLNLTFKEIIYNYRKQPQCKPQVFRSVFVDWTSARHNGKTGSEHVDIITFYNEMFIPSVKPLLVELAPSGNEQKKNHVEKAKNEGQGPASPKPSSFPSLPDMSPKKVSAVHNVYVSPLRSSKMDALISHSSKSYYACVGESTHAYQSPSKDLSVINNRLNGTRKLRGALNFDDVDAAGLVSDSIVANSLYLQNGNCISSPRAAVKTEQPES